MKKVKLEELAVDSLAMEDGVRGRPGTVFGQVTLGAPTCDSQLWCHTSPSFECMCEAGVPRRDRR